MVFRNRQRSYDTKLCELNDDYAYVRKYNLKTPIIKIVPTHFFYDFLESLGKSGGQNKMPRVLNTEQSQKWNAFIGTN
ncbi:MAG: hypothetical protein EBS86_00100 [Crocinitomicaceae bacterium]|nr:hypothetical protein [Crocinitomicaceae bacterium]